MRPTTTFTSKIRSLMTPLALATAVVTAGCGLEEVDEPAGTSTIEVDQTLQSSCKHGPMEKSSSVTEITIVQQGDAITVKHANAYHNCLAKLKMAATQEGSTLRVDEIITNPQDVAKCMCHFDLSVTIKGLEPGTYAVKVFNPDGALLETLTVVIKGTPACAPMDANAQGACKMLITSYKWDGNQCVMLGGGCSCKGTDCDKLFKTSQDCQKAHAHCTGK